MGTVVVVGVRGLATGGAVVGGGVTGVVGGVFLGGALGVADGGFGVGCFRGVGLGCLGSVRVTASGWTTTVGRTACFFATTL